MRSIDGRLSKLEHRLGIARNAPRYLLIMMRAGQEFGPADDAYIESLDEAGLLPISGFGVVDLIHKPSPATVKQGARVGPAPVITIELV
jgi:hypothetical protein